MSLRDLAIGKKIVLITMLISAAALLIAGAQLYSSDRVQSRRELESSVMTIAAITADNVMSAVSFSDEKTAREALGALESDPPIVAACVYADQELLSDYKRPGASIGCPPQPASPGFSYEGNYLHTTVPILQKDGRKIGALRVTTTLEPLAARAWRDLEDIGLVTLVASAFALILSSLLQRWISRPLLALTETTRTVSETHNYSVRAKKFANDELGMLVDSVNEMLSQISQAAADRELQLGREHDLRKEAEEANRLKDEFLSTLSHELRTPLNAIVGWSALLRTRPSIDSDTKAGLDVVYRNAHSQAKLIEELLNVSQIITGKLPMEFSNVKFRETVDAAIEAILLVAASKNVELVTEHAGDELCIRADAGRIQQAVANVLSNAVKFTHEGGRVVVHTESTDTDVQLSITDNGIGIPADFLPFVFDRFRQADGSISRSYGGLGIGLAITRHIVESHKGTIGVSSAGPGKGTTFRISIPRRQG